jgi:hypothetical protein
MEMSGRGKYQIKPAYFLFGGVIWFEVRRPKLEDRKSILISNFRLPASDFFYRT